MKIKVHSPVGYAVLFAGLLATACSRQPSEPQSTLAPAASWAGHRTAIPDAGAVFPLVQGSFSIGNRAGDGIVGSYTGSSAAQNSSLALQVTGGSGAFAGAVGSLGLAGTGAFAGEGAFALDGIGEVTLEGGKKAVLVLSLRGSSSAACSPSQQIAIGQTADGTMGRAGRVTARLRHTVENTGCIS